MAEYIASEKGKPMLYVNGNKIYWKCQNFAKSGRCRAITIDDEVTSVSKEHNHTGYPADVEVRRLRHKIKNDAKEIVIRPITSFQMQFHLLLMPQLQRYLV